MIVSILAVGLVTCAIAISMIGYLVVQTQIEIKALQRSTHQIQYVRSDEFDKITAETKEKLEKEFFDNVQ